MKTTTKTSMKAPMQGVVKPQPKKTMPANAQIVSGAPHIAKRGVGKLRQNKPMSQAC